MKRLLLAAFLIAWAQSAAAAVMLQASGSATLSGNSFLNRSVAFDSGLQFRSPGNVAPLAYGPLDVLSSSEHGSGFASTQLTTELGAFHAAIREQVVGDFSVAGDAYVHGEWRDTLKIASADPNDRRQVTITTTTIVHVDEISASNATWHLWLRATNNTPLFEINNTNTPGGVQNGLYTFTQSYTQSLNGLNPVNINIGQVFDARVRSAFTTGGSGRASINALNTVNFYVTEVPEGVIVSSESGQTYAPPALSAVPEPASLTLAFWSVGALATATIYRRRRQAVTAPPSSL